MYIPTYMLLRQFKLTGGWLRWHFKRKNLWWSWRKSTYTRPTIKGKVISPCPSGTAPGQSSLTRAVLLTNFQFDNFDHLRFLSCCWRIFRELTSVCSTSKLPLHCWIIKIEKKNEPAMAGNLNSTLAQKSRRSEKRNHHHAHHAVLCILFPMNISLDLTRLLVSLKWSPCDLLCSLISYRDVSSFSLVYPLHGGWLLGLGVCVCCAASACIHADVCSIITSSLAVKFIIVLKKRACVCVRC